jgi:hypothetical protein
MTRFVPKVRSQRTAGKAGPIVGSIG